MVWVRWELDGDEIDDIGAELAVQHVLMFHKRALGGLSCPVHGQEPWLTVRGSTLQNLSISIETCCRVMKEQAEERIRRVSRREE